MLIIKDLISVENHNPLILEMTKSYFSSNNIKCMNFIDYTNAFICVYSIFKDEVEKIENSNISIEDMKMSFYEKFHKETN